MIKQNLMSDGLHTKCETDEREFRDEYLISDLDEQFDYLTDCSILELVNALRRDRQSAGSHR